MRHRFILLTALAAIALALVAPALPAGADDGVNCYEEIVFDPTYWDDDVPPEPPPEPGMAPGTLAPAPTPTPTPHADTICLVASEVSPVFASDRTNPAYLFRVGAEYCVNPQGRILRVTPIVPTPVPTDPLVSIFFGPRPKVVTDVPAGSSVTSADVVFQLGRQLLPGRQRRPDQGVPPRVRDHDQHIAAAREPRPTRLRAHQRDNMTLRCRPGPGGGGTFGAEPAMFLNVSCPGTRAARRASS